jgi:serine/threonine protein kinase
VATDLLPGSQFGAYRVERLIARGGMGAVYLAADLAGERAVALKLVRSELADDRQFRARFERESRLTVQLDHPHVVPLYHAGEVNGTLFSASRFIDGTDLQALIAHHGALHPAWAALVVEQVGSALDAAHARGLIHRDVKPANILLEERDGEVHAYLADFGLSKHVSSLSGLTRTGMWVGTIDYAAPEQIQAQGVGPPADIYALGCVLYEMLTGEVPLPRARELDKITAHAVESPPPLPGPLPSALGAVIARALAKAPEERYPSASCMAGATTAAVAGAPAPAGRLIPIAEHRGAGVDREAPTTG